MAFSQTSITSVSPPVWSRGQIHLSWTSTAPAGTWYQVYVARKLAWFGQATNATVPGPSDRSQVDIGSVDSAERAADLSASLPAPPSDRVNLKWSGGTFQDANIVGFRIYAQSGFGSGGFGDGGFGMGSPPIGNVLAYTPGIYTDGFGYGGFGEGGFGSAAGSYSWTSQSLAGGDWSFSIVPYNAAGNEGSPVVGSATISAPPNPPAMNPFGKRLTVTYNATTHEATLAWLASPE
jgi:hypothetical protein